MEVVAITDIAPGDEVTIDYGEEWAAAWEDHIEAWNDGIEDGTIPDPWPIRALDMNAEYKNKPFEIESDYPENVMLKCFLMVKKPTDEPPINEAGEKVRIWTETPETMDSENLFDCTITDLEEVETEQGKDWLYTVNWSSRD